MEITATHRDDATPLCFVMGEFDMTGLPERPATLKFVDQIKVDILLEHKIEG